MKRVDLPGGAWANLKEAEEITRGERKQLDRMLRRARAHASDLLESGYDPADVKTWGVLKDLSDEAAEWFDPFQNLCISTCLISWSGGSNPETDEDFDRLPAPVYEELVYSSIEVVLGSRPTMTVDGAADPKAPTEDSNEPQDDSTETSTTSSTPNSTT